MENLETNFDFKKFETEALKGLQNGDGLFGDKGILKSLVQHLVQAALEGELQGHLKGERVGGLKNKRNGYGKKKKLKTEVGVVEIDSPRDREGRFNPVTVGKWERQLGSGFTEQVLELYSMGNSLSDIRLHLRKMYGAELSEGTLSSITDSVLEELARWRKRPLNNLYVLVYLDAVHFNIRTEGKVVNRATYTLYGINACGERDILAFWVGNNEGAGQWMLYLEDLKARGVEDVLFFAIDGLAGLSDAITAIYPDSIVQRCIVHMVRTSLVGVEDKDRREVCQDLKLIYTATTEKEALKELEEFEKKWGKKYPSIGKKWRASWLDLTAFLEYPKDLRRLIYTTNAIENVHRQMRKVTKTKAAWTSEGGLEKQLYLGLMRKKASWARKVHKWSAIQITLMAKFGERYTRHVDV